MLLQNKVKRLKNELQALKQAQPLNGGALTRNSATATWTGTINKSNPISQYSMLAAFILTYTRNDGVVKTPLVQFAFSLDPSATAYGAVTEIGGDFVSYKLILPENWWPSGNTSTTVSLTITASAYSPVSGDLTITRVYS